jgi:hypothetical protein
LPALAAGTSFLKDVTLKDGTLKDGTLKDETA